MEDKDYILRCLQEYANEYCNEPRWGLKKGVFDHRAYARSAMCEIYRAVKLSDESPMIAVGKFASKVLQYTSYGTGKNEMIFRIYYEQALEILDFLRAITDGKENR